jgi:hypothetical protein
LSLLTRLPIPVGPARHETVVSYLTRLAGVHALPVGELWDQLAGPMPGDRPRSRRRVVVPDRLAVVTGRPVEHLAQAMPELRGPSADWTPWRHQPQPGCPCCDARHDGGPVWRLLPHCRYVCTRHRYWIGPPDTGQPATPLGPGEVAEELARAQHQHQRLVARHGTAAVFDAVLTGFLICGHLWDHCQREQTGAWHHWVRRVDQLIPPGTELDTFSTSLLYATVYPEAVSLAGLIAASRWRQLASGEAGQQRQFLAEACRRVGRTPDDDHGIDVIRHWMIFDSHHPPSRPEKTFPQTRDHGATRTLDPNPASLERTRRSAAWFATKRRGGSSILHHRHIRPVLKRDWAPELDGIAATIAASASLFDYGHNARCNLPHRKCKVKLNNPADGVQINLASAV